MKNIFLVFMIVMAFVNVRSQVSSIKVGVDGVTCSMCSKGTEKSIKRLTFVQNVVMELNTAEAEITIKTGFEADFKAIAQAVKDAGFSVRYIKFTYTTSTPNIIDFKVGKSQYKLIGGNLKSGANYVALVGKDFMDANEFKTWESALSKQTVDAKAGVVYYIKVI